MDERDALKSVEEASQAGAGPSSSSNLQEKCIESDSISPSQILQRPGAKAQGSLRMDGAGPVMECASVALTSIELLNQRYNDVKRKLHQMDLKKKSLQEVCEKRQEMIVCAQLEVEQLSGQFYALIRNRQIIQDKVQYASQQAATFQQFCGKLQSTFSQLSSSNEDLTGVSKELLEMFKKISRAKTLPGPLLKVERLTNNILEMRKKRAIKEQEAKTRLELDNIRHEKCMAKILKETEKVKKKVQHKRLELATAMQRREGMQKRIHVLAATKDDEEIKEQTNSVTILEKKIHTTTETQLKPVLEENLRLSAVSKDLDEEISVVAKRIEVLEQDEINIKQKWKDLSEKLVEADSKESGLTDKLNKTRLMNLETESQLASIRKKMEVIKIAGEAHMSELEIKLLNNKDMNSKRSAHFMEEITATRQNCDLISKKCDEKRDTLSVLTSQSESLQNLLENALEENQSLDNHFKTMAEENQRLSNITQELRLKVSADEKKLIQLEESLCERRYSAEESEISLKNKLSAIKDETLSINEKIAAREQNIATLRNNLEEVESNSLKSRELAHGNFKSVIDEQRNTIALYGQKTRAVIQNHERRANELTEQLEKYNQNLAEIEDLLLSAQKTSHTVFEEIESLENAQKRISDEFELKKSTENELMKKCKVFKRNFEQTITKQAEVASHLHEEKKTLQAKITTTLELQQQIDELEKSKSEAAVQNSDEIKEIMHDILKTKQMCESLFCTTSDLTNEINHLKSSSEIQQTDYDSKHKLMVGLESKTEIFERKSAKVHAELDKILKSTEKLQTKVALTKRDTLSSNQKYDKLIKDIAARKAQKAKESLPGTSTKSSGRDKKKSEGAGSVDKLSELNMKDNTNNSTQADTKENQEGKP